SANIGEKYAFFEPVHGSAPDIAGKGIANPVAAIRSAAMMLEHFGMKDEACLVEESISSLISRGISTPDLGGMASTSEFGSRLVDAVSKKE
ncbi:MAG: isocitrate/isopropylmalate family dehydrogenase, partial [Methanocorpusculum sp.]|nr:isocitrate/isopropylmalate family dehydrogenase [Methanocorpusculum sp.]